MQSPATNIPSALIHVLYPPQCLGCGAFVAEDFALCPTCWTDTPFITGLTCDLCGTPLPGEADTPVACDDCLTVARPWDRAAPRCCTKAMPAT